MGKNPGQISGLARAENIKAWKWVASENSGGRDYNAGDFRENNPAGPPKLKAILKSKHDAPADWLKAEKRPDDHYFSDPDANGGQPGLTKDNAVWIGRASK